MNKVKAGIIGGAGYTGGELIRILVNHPGVEIDFIQSDSQAGIPVRKIHQDLFNMPDLLFTEKISDEADVYFLCKGHGETVKMLENGLLPRDGHIIDLSQDLRVSGINDHISEKYGAFVYGLPEMFKDEIRKAKNIANPGCFATCIQLGLLPLAKNHLLKHDIHVGAITGSTGAGQSLSATSHFTWRNNNLSVYKPFRHQHLKEIRQNLVIRQQNPGIEIHFIPYRGNFTRGIMATLYMESDMDQEEARDLFASYYSQEPFVFISDTNIDLKQVVNSNYCLLYIEKIGKQLMIISIIDNLLKGASGQAVQNMNLMFAIEEHTGLNLKAAAF